MVTGSVASSLQGEPRATHDIDLVVTIPPAAVDGLVGAFPPPDFLVQAESVRDAIRNRSMFNLLSLSEGEKVDFWILTDEPFDRSRFARRRAVDLPAGRIMVCSPEDTILAKLRWSKLAGGSAKQYGDALRVYEIQYAGLDVLYLERWASQLGVGEEWGRLRREAVPPTPP
jgi:hypothetical protein